MKRLTVVILFFIVSLLPLNIVKADYVLPYPSYLPGNKLYQLSLLLDKLENFWYWGNIAQFKYHLKLADKYLVEAKTLFEYEQYLLAVRALGRSDREFKQILPDLTKADKQGEDISQLKTMFSAASLKHIAVLTALAVQVPQIFVWTPEKNAPTTLKLGQLLKNSIEIRKNDF